MARVNCTYDIIIRCTCSQACIRIAGSHYACGNGCIGASADSSALDVIARGIGEAVQPRLIGEPLIALADKPVGTAGTV